MGEKECLQNDKRSATKMLRMSLAVVLICFTSAPVSAQAVEEELLPGFARVAGGTFTMGSAVEEAGRDDDEGPQHQVMVSTFALAVTEVTRGEFAKFVAATGYETDAERNPRGCGAPKPDSGVLPSWRDPGFAQTDEHPVVCVSRNDAERYAAWMSDELGTRVRLPTEAEFEYALRANSQTRLPWGTDDNAACTHGNIGDVRFKQKFENTPNTGACDDGFTYTSPVGGYAADKYGIKDLSGNVWEWSADCFQDSYEGAPTDGSARTSSNCEFGVLRGASFDDGPRYQRSANRVRVAPDVGAWVFGIRLAQDQ